ncbi:MAG: hypothetical protein GEU79_04600 [Acidimicrobiia bacterium]|nr:hypothetical protein [Acidimicrobiia bacterium]
MNQRFHRASRIPFGVVGLAIILILALPVLAHTEFLGSDPEDAALVATLPETVELTFSDTVIEPVAVALTGPDGRDIAEGGASISGEIVTQRLTPEPNPPAGTYTIAFQVSATDGHPLTGEVVFTLEPEEPITTTTEAQPTTSSSTQPTTTAAATTPSTTSPSTTVTPTTSEVSDTSTSTPETSSQDGVSTGAIIGLAGGLGVALALVTLVLTRSVKQRGGN